MSYDFWMEIDTGGSQPYCIEPRFNDVHPAFACDGMAGNVLVTMEGYSRCGNYTGNVSPMWKRCLSVAYPQSPVSGITPLAKWCGTVALWDLASHRGEEVAPLLAGAVRWGIEHIDKLRLMNPPNGWGNAEGAITYLWDIQRMCERHPKATLRISL